MALRTPPSFLQNGSHPAEQDRLTTQGLFRTSGILSAADLAVTQSTVPAMSVQIAAGWGNIIGTTQANMGAYQFYNDAAATATITTADVTNPRIDLICITINDAYYTGVTNNVAINVVAGTPAASPAVPATPANSYALAQVAVAANATTITNANITDLRQVASVVNVAQSVAGKNALINGAMDIWQRGTSIAVAASTQPYTADRWTVSTFANEACTVSRQATADTINLPNIQYALRFQRNAGQTGTSLMGLVQSLETINSIPFAGKTVTLSFYARAGANYSATSSLLSAYIFSGTGTDENRLSAPYTGNTQVALTSPALTTTWQRFTVTGTVPATATELSPYFTFTPTGTAGVNDYFEITGVQLELGSTATTFSRAGGSIGQELSLCQRYYQKSYTQLATVPTNVSQIGIPFVILGSGTVAAGAYFAWISFATPMRVGPTVTIYSYTSSITGAVSTAGGTDLAAASGGTNFVGDKGFALQNNSGAVITPAVGGFVFHYAASSEL